MTEIRAVSVHPDDDNALVLAGHLIDVRCCRTWQVSPLYKWGRCKLCGEKPR